MMIHPPSYRRLTTALIAASTALSCDVNPFDRTQQPVVIASVQGGSAGVVVSWQPAGAQLVRVYRGATAGDGYTPSLVWSVAATTRNSLISPIPYGTDRPIGGTSDVPSRPLVPGEIYTVQVTRLDPKGTGDGFTNTGNRYVGTTTFTVASAVILGR